MSLFSLLIRWDSSRCCSLNRNCALQLPSLIMSSVSVHSSDWPTGSARGFLTVAWIFKKSTSCFFSLYVSTQSSLMNVCENVFSETQDCVCVHACVCVCVCVYLCYFRFLGRQHEHVRPSLCWNRGGITCSYSLGFMLPVLWRTWRIWSVCAAYSTVCSSVWQTKISRSHSWDMLKSALHSTSHLTSSISKPTLCITNNTYF